MRTSMRLAILALVAVLVGAFLASPALAKGGGGGGGHVGGGGGAAAGGGAARGGSGGHEAGAGEGGSAAKPSGSKEAGTPASSKAGTGYEAPPQAVGSRSNPYYGYPGYGLYHNNLSNFFLWYWLFHPHHRCDRNNNDNEATQSGSQSSGETAGERCDFDYQYRYGGEPNYGVGGWTVLAILGTVAVAVFFVLKKYRGMVGVK
jgi:hypothetical protein